MFPFSLATFHTFFYRLFITLGLSPVCLAVWFHRLVVGMVEKSQSMQLRTLFIVQEQANCLRYLVSYILASSLTMCLLVQCKRKSVRSRCTAHTHYFSPKCVCAFARGIIKTAVHIQRTSLHIFWTTLPDHRQPTPIHSLPTEKLHFNLCGFSPMWTSKWNVKTRVLLNSFLPTWQV